MNSQLQNKLASYEAPPPPGAWEKIAASLEESQPFADRLFHYGETPAPHNWPHIENTLNKELTPATVIPFHLRFKRPIRYVAAATMIGVFLVATTLLQKRTEAGSLSTNNTTNVTVPKKESAKNLLPPANITATLLTRNNVVEPAANLKTRLLNFIHLRKTFPADVFTMHLVPKQAVVAPVLSQPPVDGYMVVTDDNGEAIRVPKKLFPFIHCEDGDASCGQRIKALQQKLSATPMTADFMAVIEMLRQVE